MRQQGWPSSCSGWCSCWSDGGPGARAPERRPRRCAGPAGCSALLRADRQLPVGLLHGGASLALAEAVGSWAAVIHASTLGKVAVGVDANATHHASARDGWVVATATPIRLGRTLTSHEVIIVHEESSERLCTFRITNAVIDRKIPGFDYVPIEPADD